MTVRIVHKNSESEDKRPTAGQLAKGEIAVNLNDAGAFLSIRDTAGNVQQVGGVKVAKNSPANPVKGTFWLDTDNNTLFIYDGTAWRGVTGGGSGGSGINLSEGPGIQINQAGSTFTIKTNPGAGLANDGNFIKVDLQPDADRNPGGNGLEIDSGKLRGRIAGTSTLGVVRVDDATLNIDNDGVISVDASIAGGLEYKGSLQISQSSAVSPEPSTGSSVAGDTYTVSEGGTIAGSSQTTDWASLIQNADTSTKVTAGDLVVCKADGGGTGNWTIVFTGGTELWRKDAGTLKPTTDNDNLQVTSLRSAAGASTNGTALAMLDNSGRFYRALPKAGIDIDNGQIRVDPDWLPTYIPGGGDGNGNFGYWNRDNSNDLVKPRRSDDLIHATNGLKVTGGTPGNVVNGLCRPGGNGIGAIENSNIIFYTEDGKARLDANLQLGDASGLSNSAVIANLTLANTGSGTQQDSIRSQCKYTGDGTSQADAKTNAIGFRDRLNMASGHLKSYKAFSSAASNTFDKDTTEVKDYYGFFVDGNTLDIAKVNSFAFYSGAKIPSFLTGSVYIGGTPTRNTRELWESTLTEEQKEQLAAGTLAIPADVSTPGDGSFVRQWWRGQQSAEDQALIDAGELEYPEHLQARNFTDTFALGDDTNINLNSSGIIEAGGYSFNANKNSSNVQSRGLVYSPSRNALLSTNRPDNADDNVDVFLGRVDNLKYDASGNRIPVNITQSTSFKSEGPLGNGAQEYGVYDSYIGFYAQNNGQLSNAAVWTGDDDSYGFLSQLGDTTPNRNYLAVTNAGSGLTVGSGTNVATTTTGGGDGNLTVNVWVESGAVVAAAIHTDGSGYANNQTISVTGYTGVELTYKTPGTGIRYNFYASGTAPNFFNGNTYIGGNTTDLGDNTNINLLSNGRIQLKGQNLGNAIDDTSGSEYPPVGTVMIGRQQDGLSIASGGYNVARFMSSGSVFPFEGASGNTSANHISAIGPIGQAFVDKAAGASIDIFSMKPDVVSTIDYTGTSISFINAQLPSGGYSATKEFRTVWGYNCGNLLEAIDASSGGEKIAYRSNIITATDKSNFNFYANGNAPNFFNGSTYIGGNTTRSTRQLWESTLTEEQQEQLSAGTLAIPANVETPGDGSFARQWWYDQQSAEDQALIDAGELDYPEPFASQTFTDTFALGENTRINLLSTGTAEIFNSSNDIANVKIGHTGSSSGRRIGIEFYGANRRDNLEGFAVIQGTFTNDNGGSGNVQSGSLTIFNKSPESNWAQQSLVCGVDLTESRKPFQVTLGNDNNVEDIQGFRSSVSLLSAGTGTRNVIHYSTSNSGLGSYATSVKGFEAEFGGVKPSGDAAAPNTGYGFYSNILTQTGVGQTAYNFYSEGTAPNWFKGTVSGGGSDGGNAKWSIASNGDATNINITRTAVVTDEQQGTVETLLDIITDLRARVAALEAAANY